MFILLTRRRLGGEDRRFRCGGERDREDLRFRCGGERDREDLFLCCRRGERDRDDRYLRRCFSLFCFLNFCLSLWTVVGSIAF